MARSGTPQRLTVCSITLSRNPFGDFASRGLGVRVPLAPPQLGGPSAHWEFASTSEALEVDPPYRFVEDRRATVRSTVRDMRTSPGCFAQHARGDVNGDRR